MKTEGTGDRGQGTDWSSPPPAELCLFGAAEETP